MRAALVCTPLLALTVVIALLVAPVPAWAQEASGAPVQPDAQAAAVLTNVKAIAGGFEHTCVLTQTDKVFCWGNGDANVLGNGLPIYGPAPVEVLRLPAGIKAIAASSSHNCALTENGSVHCWGSNGSGELGDGTRDARVGAVAAVGLTDVAEVAVGGDFTCALTPAGSVLCWGSNFYGQLGNGSYEGYNLTPRAVSGLSDVKAITAGGSHACALTTAGVVKCWGMNMWGQLGDGTQMDRRVPAAVVGLGSGIQAISGGPSQTCAITDAGALLCWGYNGYGQLGVAFDGPASAQTTPTPVTGLDSGVAGVAGGWDHTCAFTTAGEMLCWGANFHGQLGDGSAEGRFTPQAVHGLAGDVTAITAGNLHSCALLATGRVQCWGLNERGELGIGVIPNPHIATPVSGLASDVVGASAGGDHTCAALNTGEVRCWGYNEFGQVGNDTVFAHPVPVVVNGLAGKVQAVVAGVNHSCALTVTGGVQCWGSNAIKQLGGGTQISSTMPVDVPGLNTGVAGLVAGSDYTCARLQTGTVACWGRDVTGKAAHGPAAIANLAGVVALGAGWSHACAVTQDGSVKCWGQNFAGQLGDGTAISRTVPVAVVGLRGRARAVAAGADHTCALLETGGVQCWGRDPISLAGGGAPVDHLTPLDVVGLSTGVTAIAAGAAHTCALLNTGGLKCWGANYYGALGDGTSTHRPEPVAVKGLTSGVAAVTAGNYYTCAINQAGALLCWGDTNQGKLGTQPVWQPTDVVAPVPTFYQFLPAMAR